ncbi:MAG: PorT family protein [Mediterranea sp.]|jgi:hypothetical protein|nr:PorT family protein [Mediterranea sp.]
MKRTLILAAFALVSVVSFSQVSWNAKVGMNISNFMGTEEGEDLNAKIGFNVGVGMEYQFTELFSLQPSLMFSMKGAKLGDLGEDAKASINPMYIQLPVLAAARVAIAENQAFVFKAGPYFAYAVSGKYKMSAGGVSASVDMFKEITDGDGFIAEMPAAKRFDCGLAIGVDYEINRIFVGLGGEIGLTKLYSEAKYKNLNFTIGVGYKF